MGCRIIEIADTFLQVLLSNEDHHYRVTRNPLPKDARIINCSMKFIGSGYQTLVLLLESEDWPKNHPGKPYEVIDMQFQTLPDVLPQNDGNPSRH